MKRIAGFVGLMACASAPQPEAAIAATPAAAAIVISRPGERPPTLGPAASFTGRVVVQPLFQTTPHTRALGASVSFEPGARTAWHTHPAGQTLVVTAGNGWIQQWNGERQAIKAGDVVWTPPGVKHWHGATTSEAMTHTAIQEQVDGKVVDWQEQVTDLQYRGATAVKKLGITIDGKTIEVELIDSQASRDLMARLPLTISLADLFDREKFGKLPSGFATKGSKKTRTYEIGDLAIWPPGPDLVVYYRHDGATIPEPGIVVLGKITSGLGAFEAPGTVVATIAALE